MSDTVVGAAGLGNIGGPIAARLAEEFTVLGYDPAKDASTAPQGVTLADSIAALGRVADVLCLSLPTTDAVHAVLRELAGVAPQTRRTRLVIELSTIGVATAERCAAIAHEAGFGYVDAPVSGGVPRARNGTLAVMCAGDPRAVEAAQAVLRQIATSVFVMGDKAGLGQAMKLANNIISAAALAVTSEALIFGARMGLAAEQMIDVINVSTGRTEVSEIKFVQTILPRNYRGAFARVMGKDVSLFLESAAGAGIDCPVARRTGEVWREFVDAAPTQDFQYIYEYLRDKAKLAS